MVLLLGEVLWGEALEIGTIKVSVETRKSKVVLLGYVVVEGVIEIER